MDLVLLAVEDRVATVTLNRPEARNAISTDLLTALRTQLARADEDPAVDVVVLTGADPAFCAGLDLKQLGSTGANLGPVAAGADRSSHPWPPLRKPLIGAVNGAAVTGGLEFALNCDFLVASERARFADTHARVGVLPGWGLSVLLPQRVGFAVARRMSFTGDYLTAEQALAAGLVTEVVPHAELLPTAYRLAAGIVSNDQEAVRALVASYRDTERAAHGDALVLEQQHSDAWLARGFDPTSVEARRQSVLARGRSQARHSLDPGADHAHR
jgi:enoyl-CoA hydratase